MRGMEGINCPGKELLYTHFFLRKMFKLMFIVQTSERHTHKLTTFQKYFDKDSYSCQHFIDKVAIHEDLNRTFNYYNFTLMVYIFFP